MFVPGDLDLWPLDLKSAPLVTLVQRYIRTKLEVRAAQANSDHAENFNYSLSLIWFLTYWSHVCCWCYGRFITISASGTTSTSNFDLRTLRAVRVLRPLKLVSGVPSTYHTHTHLHIPASNTPHIPATYFRSASETAIRPQLLTNVPERAVAEKYKSVITVTYLQTQWREKSGNSLSRYLPVLSVPCRPLLLSLCT